MLLKNVLHQDRAILWRPRAEWGFVLLVWSCLLLLPFGRLVEVPVLLMAIAGLVLLIRRRQWVIGSPSARLFTTAYLVAWVPIVLSLPDAFDFSSSVRVALGHTRFYFSGLFIIYCIATIENHERLLRLAAWLLAVWVVDGFVQLASGTDILGFDASPTRINALFGDRNPKYGIMLAVLSPLLFEYARHYRVSSVFAMTAIGTTAIVLIVGTRSSWIMLAVIAVGYFALLWLRDRRIPWRVMFVTVAASALLLGALYTVSGRFSQRVDSALAGITSQAEVAKNAVSHRFFIWQGAINMIASHPLNGVGVRGFRDAFPAYADPDDPFFNAVPPITPTHSHQLVLELLAETGLIGLLGTIIMLTLLVHAALRADVAARTRVLPYGLCLLAGYFPINTHLAIYSSYWSQVLWWLTAVYCSGFFRDSHTQYRGVAP